MTDHESTVAAFFAQAERRDPARFREIAERYPLSDGSRETVALLSRPDVVVMAPGRAGELEAAEARLAQLEAEVRRFLATYEPETFPAAPPRFPLMAALLSEPEEDHA